MSIVTDNSKVNMNPLAENALLLEENERLTAEIKSLEFTVEKLRGN